MSHIKKKFQFLKVIEEYDFMKEQLKKNEEKKRLDETILLLNCENLNYEEFERIFLMLRHTLTLQSMILKCKGNFKIVNEVDKSYEAENYTDGPIFFTKYALQTLYQGVTDYLYNSDRIRILAFKSIPITGDLPLLCQGIRNNKSLRVLHFQDCEICDDGCIQLCQALRKLPVESLGLENCKITLTGASWLAWLIREQSMLRTLTNWNKYQNDHVYKTEQGVRKMVLNDNPGIKDSGAKFIISTLFDDDWLTHIHMQNTGLTDATGHLILRLLKDNKSLTLFDVSQNYITSNHMIERINFLASSSELNPGELEPKFSKKLTRRKKKIIKKKRSKTCLDKERIEKSPTSESSLCSEPFLMVSKKAFFGSSYNITRKTNNKRSGGNKVLEEKPRNRKSKVKLPVMPKQFDPVLRLDEYLGLERKFQEDRKGIDWKGKVKGGRDNVFDKKEGIKRPKKEYDSDS